MHLPPKQDGLSHTSGNWDRSTSDKLARRALCYGVLALTKFAYPHQSDPIILSSGEAAASNYRAADSQLSVLQDIPQT